MRNSVCLAAVLQLIFCLSPVYAAGPYNPFKMGNWSGGSFTNDATGGFSHCAASVVYNSGTSLFVSITTEGSWLLGFSNNAWRLNPGNLINLNIFFDNQTNISVSAVVKSSNFVVVNMPDNSNLIKIFRQAHLMVVYAAGNQFQFFLSQTSRLLPVLIGCAQRRGASAPHMAIAPPTTRLPLAPPTPSENPEAAAERSKLISQAANEYGGCQRKQMRDIIPYSNENAETIAQVVLTKCDPEEQKFISLA